MPVFPYFIWGSKNIMVHLRLVKSKRMYLSTDKKKEIFKTYGKSENDSGTAEAQVALFTERINHLTEHLKKNKKDFGTERALISMVGKRKKLLKYLEHKDIERYRAIIKKLNLRK